MGSKKVFFRIAVRVVGLILLLTVILYYVFISWNYLRALYVGILIIVLIVELIYYLNKLNKDFSSFLDSIINDDFTSYYSRHLKNRLPNKIYEKFNAITEKYNSIRTDKEIQYIYLQTLIRQIQIGILSFSKDGKISLINETLKKLLNKPNIRSGSKISEFDKEFINVITSIKPGQRKLVNIQSWDESYRVSVLATDLKIRNKSFKLISAHNIKGELEEHELDSWQKLIRVLTHEIMNSVTPITSLSSSLYDMLETKRNQRKEIDEKAINTLSEGLEAIIDRSRGLKEFTAAYKKLTALPSPDFRNINIEELIKNVEILFIAGVKEKNITLLKQIDNNVDSLYADNELISQVLINLLNNAYDAVVGKDDAKIIIRVLLNMDQKVSISIEDNGPGIPDNVMEKIFIPFFTTKENGTGIGLSLSRQIMRLHGGNINVQSEKGKGSAFILRF